MNNFQVRLAFTLRSLQVCLVLFPVDPLVTSTCSTWDSCCSSFRPFHFVHRDRPSISNRDPLHIVPPMAILPMSVRKFFPTEPKGIEFCPKIWSIGMADESKRLSSQKHLHLGVSRHCITCLFSSWLPGNHIHNFAGRHVRRARFLLTEHNMRSVVFFFTTSTHSIGQPMYFGVPQPFHGFLKWHKSLIVARMHCFASSACSMSSSKFLTRFSPGWQFIQCLPLLVNCGPPIKKRRYRIKKKSSH